MCCAADRAILYETGKKSHEWLHTGEMLQVGQVWRLTEVPTGTEPSDKGPVATGPTGKLKDLMDELTKLDQPPTPTLANRARTSPCAITTSSAAH